MTKEAKIGMLTGLVVIVLIGVLLSEYLGGGAPASGNVTMASLPVGEGYRQEVMSPVGVPPAADLNGGNEQTAPIVTTLGDVPPAYAVDGQGGGQVAGPTVGAPVTPIAAMAPMDGRGQRGGVPTISAPDGGVSGTMQVVGKEYVIQSGDNLAKIAKLFYGTAKNSDVQRIVAANPAVLKDGGATLIAGKKLVIPVAAGVASPGRTTVTSMTGSASGTVYEVQAGDTLDKIAKKLSPQHPGDMVQRLMSLNGIKDARGLQAGMKLKVPG